MLHFTQVIHYKMLFVRVTKESVPPVLCDEFDEIFCGNLVAFLFEERREATFPVHCALVVLKYWPGIYRRKKCYDWNDFKLNKLLIVSELVRIWSVSAVFICSANAEAPGHGKEAPIGIHLPYRPGKRHSVLSKFATELLIGFQHLLDSLEQAEKLDFNVFVH